MASSPLRGPDRYETCLAVAAALLLCAVVAAVARGQADWAQVPVRVWLHIGTIVVALALTPVMLLRRRGDGRHKLLGWIWCAALAATAVISFDIRLINRGGFSIIHILSVWTLIQIPWLVYAARTHRHATHRRAVRGMVTGASHLMDGGWSAR